MVDLIHMNGNGGSCTSILSCIDWRQPSLYASLVSIMASPLIWNIVARNEYKRKTLTRAVGPYIGCSIWNICHAGCKQVSRGIIFLAGNSLVGTSFWRLGFYGTYLGDYFGILMNGRVEAFPFNVLNHPMYVGSTLCFFGAALWYERPAGLLVAVYVHFVYVTAVKFEEPFTVMIYAERGAKSSK
ncbi:phospholipid methyltransferase-domain-containing protein [Mucidula mucida]|nr:phospholipid methyltransferase-domain-containing protein [Mucidula mucida]